MLETKSLINYLLQIGYKAAAEKWRFCVQKHQFAFEFRSRESKNSEIVVSLDEGGSVGVKRVKEQLLKF